MWLTSVQAVRIFLKISREGDSDQKCAETRESRSAISVHVDFARETCNWRCRSWSIFIFIYGQLSFRLYQMV